MRNFVSATALALACATGMNVSTAWANTTTAVVQPDPDEERRRQRQTLSTSVARVLGDVFNDLNSDLYQQALNKLNDLMRRELNNFDRSTVLELRANAYFNLENQNAALQDYVSILSLDALPFDRLRQIRYNVAQLYFVNENFPEAIRTMRTYLDEAGDVEDPNAWYILAAGYALQGDYGRARQPAENVVRYDSDQQRKNFDLLNLIYSELNLSAERGRLLEQMVELFPDDGSLWAQLSGSYAEAGDDRRAFSSLEVAYKAGLLVEEDKIVALAQYYSRLENPYRAGLLIEREMAAGNVERDLGNLELLAQLWSMSRDQDRAIQALTAAAQISPSGELFYRLGQSYMANQDYQNALTNLRQALDRGGLSRRVQGDIYMLMGSAEFALGSETAAGRAAALRSFRQAANYTTARREANGWIEYIGAIERTRQQQRQIEEAQRREALARQIERCETLIGVSELQGIARDNEAPDVVACRDLIASNGEDAEPAAETTEQ